ncbi:ribose 5-phosphate isomerase B [Fervidobacterium changbaicum]|uniref:RpiB/LacA/LacB family sugar-phosphate isomerase n=2 Tax=Fervidobacterium TaxID=2422 RepID=A0AAI8CLR3_FERIS|nr:MULTISPECIES: RpiB/LacA/LacB family sugar-phosphate isomerase [Fervidobacterium]AMW32883.1 RpiB/LacA/LacB family sugar-phosphate isomerase [Fervidobacterium islandicum]QAV32921.1 RpiB/LacA/LacB family sugar-phosphate isomerase [Fervidobacterium changbaicum]SDH48288.1 ribose 5-phosphate isomerase B [Fervidobacterium changbaicum]
MDEKRIVIGSDKSGFNLKEAVKKHLQEKGYEVEDVGTLDPENWLPYYVVAPRVAKKIQSGEYKRGILICGTGAGMSIVANKFKGIYAVAVEGSYTGKMAKVVNNANVLTMGGWVIAPEQACDIVDKWLEASFTEGFPEWRQEFLRNAYKEVQKIEEENFR